VGNSLFPTLGGGLGSVARDRIHDLVGRFVLGEAPDEIRAELSTQRAAELLNVSRPFMVKLLDEGRLPYRKVGKHRRIRLVDVLAYKRRDDEERRVVLERLASEGQALQMGY